MAPCALSWLLLVAPGVSARLVHQQLSTHLLGALQHQMQQQMRHGAARVGPGGSGHDAAAQQAGHNKHLAALSLGAVTAEVQEGLPGEVMGLLRA